MKKGLIISAIVLVLAGLALFAVAAVASGYDLSKFNTSKYETNTYDISEGFSNISLDTDTADVVFAPSADGRCRAVFYENEKVKHTASVKEGTLFISVLDGRKWYDHITFFSVGTPKITLYLPQPEYASLFIDEDTGDIEIPKDFKFESIDISAETGDVQCYASASGPVRIKLSTGDVRLENASAGEVEISTSTGTVHLSSVACAGNVGVTVSTGKTTLTDVTCKSLVSSGSTGDITMKNVIVSENISIDRSTGDLKFDGCDAAELFIKTDTGDVKGTLLSEKVFITRSDTGRVDVPKTANGGRCEITTDTGDIRIGLIEK